MEKVATQKVQNMLVVLPMGKKFIHLHPENIQIKFRTTQTEVGEVVVVMAMAVDSIIDPAAEEITVQVRVVTETEMVGVEEVEDEVETVTEIISEEITKNKRRRFRSNQKQIKNSN